MIWDRVLKSLQIKLPSSFSLLSIFKKTQKSNLSLLASSSSSSDPKPFFLLFSPSLMEVSNYYYSKKSGQILHNHQIPVFGEWDKAKDLPITQYFETAHQAGLIRYSSSSGECGPCPAVNAAIDRHKPPPSAAAPRKIKQGRVREKRYPHVSLKEQPVAVKKQQGKVFDVTEQGSRKVKQNDMSFSRPTPRLIARPPKPVDEDLYKIPPELLHSSKRNKMKGLFSRCLVPACS